MIVQWYKDGREARVFSAENTLLAELTHLPYLEMVDARLKLFGLCRNKKWQRLSWGFEAVLHKVK